MESSGNTGYTGERAVLRKELYDSAMTLLDKHGSLEEVYRFNDSIKSFEGKDCKVYLVAERTWDEGKSCYAIVCKGRVEGLSIAQFKKVRDNKEEMMKKMTNKMFTPYILENPPGADAALLANINLPFPMTNRSFMTCTYYNDMEDGSYWEAGSSRDTEALVEQHKDKIKKNVVGTTHMNFTMLKDTEAGVEWSNVIMSDMNGSFPNAAKKKMTEKQAQQSHDRIHFMLTGQPRE